MRYLIPEIIEATLRRRKSIEQFLGRGAGPQTIAWLELRPGPNGVSVWKTEVPDAGDLEHLDLYEFGGYLDTRLSRDSTSVEDALTHAHADHGAQPKRWVNEGMIQGEYRDFIVAGRPARWPPSGV